jgi:hypothetical protein
MLQKSVGKLAIIVQSSMNIIIQATYSNRERDHVLILEVVLKCLMDSNVVKVGISVVGDDIGVPMLGRHDGNIADKRSS